MVSSAALAVVPPIGEGKVRRAASIADILGVKLGTEIKKPKDSLEQLDPREGKLRLGLIANAFGLDVHSAQERRLDPDMSRPHTMGQ